VGGCGCGCGCPPSTDTRPLNRDSFGGTFAKWPNACLEYIFMFAKKKCELSKTFGHGFCPISYQCSCLLPACHSHLATCPLWCICTSCQWHFGENLCEMACPSYTEIGILCFLKFNGTLLVSCVCVCVCVSELMMLFCRYVECLHPQAQSLHTFDRTFSPIPFFSLWQGNALL